MSLSDEQRTLRLGELIAADLSDDGTLLVAADKNSALVLDVESGHDLLWEAIHGHSSDWKDVRFATRPHENGPRRIWSASLDGTVKLWGLSAEQQSAEQVNETRHYTVRQLLTLRGHHGGVLALAPLSDGGVATAGMDGRVILWPIHSASSAK
jgi:WD40 repeat protein